MRGDGWENRIDIFFADLRYAARGLVGNPGFAALSIFTLALGIGASTAIFSVVDAVLLRALRYPNPQNIVRVWEQAPNGHRMNLADPDFDDFQSRTPRSRNWPYTVAPSLSRFPAAASLCASISPQCPAASSKPLVSSLFAVALFAPEEQRLHGVPVAIVSYSY